MSVGNPAAKRQLPIGLRFIRRPLQWQPIAIFITFDVYDEMSWMLLIYLFGDEISNPFDYDNYVPYGEYKLYSEILHIITTFSIGRRLSKCLVAQTWAMKINNSWFSISL